jgi:hypothetical protein
MARDPSPDRRIGIRVNLTLPESVVAALDRIAAVTGSGRATLIREFLVEAEPGFRDMAHALELAKNNNLDAFTVLAKTIRETSQQADQLHLNITKTRRAMQRKRKA